MNDVPIQVIHKSIHIVPCVDSPDSYIVFVFVNGRQSSAYCPGNLAFCEELARRVAYNDDPEKFVNSVPFNRPLVESGMFRRPEQD